MKNDDFFRALLWSIIIAQMLVLVWFQFFYHPNMTVKTALAPMVKSVDSMLPQFPGFPGVTLSQPTTVLFMGTDVVYSGGRHGVKSDHVTLNGNSDTMMLCFLNPQHNTASVLNIPRDTEAFVGDHGIQKINSANPLGGPELAKETVTGLLQVPVDHYVIMNIQGLVQMVNELGGITVVVPKKMTYMDWTAKLKIDLQPGVHTLTGNQAMGFVRFRHDGLGDIGRVQRQQIFLQAVAKKMSDPSSWVHLPALLAIAQDNIETDMSQMDILSALNFLHTVPRSTIKFVMLPGQFSTTNGDWIATTDGRTIAWQMANPGEENVSSRKNISICVINATTDRTFGSRLARSLRKLGYVTSVGPDEENPLDGVTQIIVQNGNTVNAKMLQQDLGNVGDVVNASVGSLISSITVVAHDDLKLDNVTLSSIDVPYEATLTRPEPLVSRAMESPFSHRKRIRRMAEQNNTDHTLENPDAGSAYAASDMNTQAESALGAAEANTGSAEGKQIPAGEQEVPATAAPAADLSPASREQESPPAAPIAQPAAQAPAPPVTVPVTPPPLEAQPTMP